MEREPESPVIFEAEGFWHAIQRFAKTFTTSAKEPFLPGLERRNLFTRSSAELELGSIAVHSAQTDAA